MAADPKGQDFRKALRIIASTQAGDVLFQWLNARRNEAHERLASGPENQVVKAQAEYRLLRDLIGHDNLNDHRPQ